jgi:hypothetical protein
LILKCYILVHGLELLSKCWCFFIMWLIHIRISHHFLKIFFQFYVQNDLNFSKNSWLHLSWVRKSCDMDTSRDLCMSRMEKKSSTRAALRTIWLGKNESKGSMGTRANKRHATIFCIKINSMHTRWNWTMTPNWRTTTTEPSFIYPPYNTF